jgi:molecular chaperone DnaK
MIKEAEENAEADKARRELVEARNQGESLIHGTEKSVAEHSDKVDPTTIEVIELSIKTLKEAMEGDDPEKIRARAQDLTEAAMKLGEAIYKAQAEADAGAAASGGGNGAAPDDDVVDADFEDLGEDDKKS